jgi:hypothetical protein
MWKVAENRKESKLNFPSWRHLLLVPRKRKLLNYSSTVNALPAHLHRSGVIGVINIPWAKVTKISGELIPAPRFFRAKFTEICARQETINETQEQFTPSCPLDIRVYKYQHTCWKSIVLSYPAL